MTTETLAKTPLHALHLELGARMVPFAGYEMPVQYPAGILKEHLHTRAAAGLFDVSHMGQLRLHPRSGRLEDAALALERLIPMDVAGLAPGRQRYGFFTDAEGGILDDLMLTRQDHARIYMVVNGATKYDDIAHMIEHLPDDVTLNLMEDHALLAVQGPEAVAALARVVPGVDALVFMQAAAFAWQGHDLWISRSGYTGEDGFEISVPAARAEDFARALLAREGAAIGPRAIPSL